MQRHEQPDLFICDPLSDAISCALLGAGQEGGLIDYTVEDLLDRRLYLWGCGCGCGCAIARLGARLRCAPHSVGGIALFRVSHYMLIVTRVMCNKANNLQRKWANLKSAQERVMGLALLVKAIVRRRLSPCTRSYAFHLFLLAECLFITIARIASPSSIDLSFQGLWVPAARWSARAKAVQLFMIVVGGGVFTSVIRLLFVLFAKSKRM